ncbi:hypothetical protein [Pedobacter alluvionis]|uniref:hypothetical protein n=1 Tax=Pedobacter alluvionis TaxID=475253 RepID=UPI00141AEAA1|nr:hypothetical protein [Pedobacter alluvionis]
MVREYTNHGDGIGYKKESWRLVITDHSSLERKACIKQEVPSRFPFLRFASSYLVAAG